MNCRRLGKKEPELVVEFGFAVVNFSISYQKKHYRHTRHSFEPIVRIEMS